MQSSRQTLLIFMYVNSICPCGKALVSLFGMCDRILLFFFRLFDLGNFFFSLPALWGLVSECSGQSAVGWLLHQHCSNAHSICMSHHSTPLTSSFPSLPLPTHTLFFYTEHIRLVLIWEGWILSLCCKLQISSWKAAAQLWLVSPRADGQHQVQSDTTENLRGSAFLSLLILDSWKSKELILATAWLFTVTVVAAAMYYNGAGRLEFLCLMFSGLSVKTLGKACNRYEQVFLCCPISVLIKVGFIHTILRAILLFV